MISVDLGFPCTCISFNLASNLCSSDTMLAICWYSCACACVCVHIRLGPNDEAHEPYTIEIRIDPHSSPTNNVECQIDAFEQNTSNWSKFINNPNHNEVANCMYWQVYNHQQQVPGTQRVIIFLLETITTTRDPVQLLVRYREDGEIV